MNVSTGSDSPAPSPAAIFWGENSGSVSFKPCGTGAKIFFFIYFSIYRLSTFSNHSLSILCFKNSKWTPGRSHLPKEAIFFLVSRIRDSKSVGIPTFLRSYMYK